MKEKIRDMSLTKKMFVIILIFASNIFLGQGYENYKLNNLNKFELAYGYDYKTPNISTIEYAIDSPIHEARHSVITKNYLDLNTSSLLTAIPEGFDFSYRLGNSNNGSQSEKLIFKVKINENNKEGYISYKFANVFNTPFYDQNPNLLPKFIVKIYKNEELLGSPLIVNSGSDSKDFLTNQCHYTVMKWTDWKSNFLDLNQFNVGDKIKLVFENYDCAIGKFFGYSYIAIKEGRN